MQAVTITQITPPELESLIEGSLRRILSLQPLNASKDEDQLMTIKQAGEFLNLSVPTIYSYVQKSKIPVSKGSKRLYFSKSELLEWIKQGRRKTQAEIALEATQFLTKRKGGPNG